jgi:hypothetical protein
VLARPHDIALVPWLIPPINLVVKEESFNAFASQSGIDIRQVRAAAIATYADENGESTFWLARHVTDPGALERDFLKRLTSKEHRSQDRVDLVRIAGNIGVKAAVMVLLGKDVVGVQSGGSATRGPARIASLYANGKLKKSPTVLAEDPLKGVEARMGAPMMAFALGPFEGELARGANGLLAGATSISAGARPSAREGIDLAIVITGDFSKSGQAASHELELAWKDLAEGSFGHLLGLDQPVQKPLASYFSDGVQIALELDPMKLARGLAAATSSRIEDIMK